MQLLLRSLFCFICNRNQIDPPIDDGESNNGVENGNAADQRTAIGLSSPIPFPAQNSHVGTQSYYQ